MKGGRTNRRGPHTWSSYRKVGGIVSRVRFAAVVGMAAAVFVFVPAVFAWAGGSFIGPLHHVRVVASTIPANGDLNPYGVAVVPRSMGSLTKGHILVSNFNDSANLSGTGTTIVEIGPRGSFRTFASIDAGNLPGTCPGGVGLTTALTVLRSGWVIVGSLPTTNGMPSTARAGCLLVLNSDGHVVETISGRPINGPWDMTALDFGRTAVLFVTNVLNGTVAAGGDVVNRGTVARVELAIPATGAPRVFSERVIGSGFAERTDPGALAVGPTGVGLSPRGTLYVADSVQSRITAIPNAVLRSSSAGTGRDVTAGGHLNDPLGLAMAPNGDILTVNGGNGKIVETTPGGNQIKAKFLDRMGAPPGNGALFGLAITPNAEGVYFVNDGTNRFELLH